MVVFDIQGDPDYTELEREGERERARERERERALAMRITRALASG
ncbi:MAG: hypothetical protein ACHQ1D_13075 [Nitrososphaerales archaeon]